jgi:hypothetical protein
MKEAAMVNTRKMAMREMIHLFLALSANSFLAIV